jgi:hypothetical protein
MHWSSQARTILLSAALIAAALASPPMRASAAEQVVIPPGKDDLIADILGRGATLPGQCRWDGGKADGPSIQSTYACPGGAVIVELMHPSTAPADAIRTEKFAIVVRSGSPPAGLIDGLAAAVRARESGFQWEPLKSTARRPAPTLFWFAAVGMLAIALLGWIILRRLTARRTPSP